MVIAAEILHHVRNQESRESIEVLPHFSAVDNTLRIGQTIVKEFRHFAPNQELLLVGFQESDWQCQIADPLPFSLKSDSRERIANVVKRLNRTQIGDLQIHFRLLNAGTHVAWKLRRTHADPRGPS